MADLDTSGPGTAADTVTISETQAATADFDAAYDTDPDTANYAEGNNPETAYRDHGSPDSPNALTSNTSENHQDDGLDFDDGAYEDTEQQQNSDDAGDPLDLWGDTDPDTYNYAEPDSSSADQPDSEPAEADAEAEAEQAPAPEQQRIDALEAENAGLRQKVAEGDQRAAGLEQKVADSDQKVAGLEQKVADLEAKDAARDARMDQFEQLLANRDRQSDAADSSETTEATPEHLEQSGDELAATRISARALDVDKSPEETTERQSKRRLPSDTRLGFGGTVAGIALGVVAEHVSPGAGQVMAYVGDALSLSIGAIAIWRENREKNNGHRPEGRGTGTDDDRARRPSGI